VLPDEASGRKVVTVGQETVTVQGRYGVVFALMLQSLLVRAASRYKVYRSREIFTGYKTDGEHWSSVAVQCWSEPEIYHGAGFKMRAAARVRMHGALQNSQDAGAKAKTMTNLFTLLTVLGVRAVKMSRYWGLVWYRKFSGFQFWFFHPGRTTNCAL
jgi:hypothetical protein